jgi:cytochrome c-type protein NapC
MKNSGFTSRLVRAFRTPSTRWGAGILASSGFFIGIFFWIGFDSFVESTSQVEMCLSCHEMREYVYAEYQESKHFGSRSGVRPMCADCHVPKSFFSKMGAKIRASSVEIPSHFLGTIDTPEKFEAKREELAGRVWARMKANDSAPCRACHDVDAMAPEEQALRAVREHEAGFAAGETCIDCHQGIAHKLPASMQEQEEEEVDFDF